MGSMDSAGAVASDTYEAASTAWNQHIGGRRGDPDWMRLVALGVGIACACVFALILRGLMQGCNDHVLPLCARVRVDLQCCCVLNIAPPFDKLPMLPDRSASYAKLGASRARVRATNAQWHQMRAALGSQAADATVAELLKKHGDDVGAGATREAVPAHSTVVRVLAALLCTHCSVVLRPPFSQLAWTSMAQGRMGAGDVVLASNQLSALQPIYGCPRAANASTPTKPRVEDAGAVRLPHAASLHAAWPVEHCGQHGAMRGARVARSLIRPLCKAGTAEPPCRLKFATPRQDTRDT